MTRQELLRFFRNFIPTHLSSVQILAFLFSLAPGDAFELVRGNLLEEMGLEEGDKAHPDMLIDLAQGLGFSEQEIGRLSAVADESRRIFASAPMPRQTLRDMGLSILLETVAFESFLSRVSDQIGEIGRAHV